MSKTEQTPTPLIEGIDSQTMRGGSYIRFPDTGKVHRVEGVDLTKAEQDAAPQHVARHVELMAEGEKKAAQAEKKPEADKPDAGGATPRTSSK